MIRKTACRSDGNPKHLLGLVLASMETISRSGLYLPGLMNYLGHAASGLERVVLSGNREMPNLDGGMEAIPDQTRNVNGRYPLSQGPHAFVERLLCVGADYNIVPLIHFAVDLGAEPDFFGGWPMDAAALHGNLSAVKYLFRRGAIPSRNWSRPLRVAMRNEEWKTAMFLAKHSDYDALQGFLSAFHAPVGHGRHFVYGSRMCRRTRGAHRFVAWAQTLQSGETPCIAPRKSSRISPASSPARKRPSPTCPWRATSTS